MKASFALFYIFKTFLFSVMYNVHIYDHNEIFCAVGSLPSVRARDSCINDAYETPCNKTKSFNHLSVSNLILNLNLIGISVRNLNLFHDNLSS